MHGKPVRASPETDMFTTARLRLPDKLKELRRPKAEVGTFADGRVQFEQQSKSDHTLAELSKVYRLRCVDRRLKSWPGQIPDVSAKLKSPNTTDEKFSDVVKSAQDAAVLVLVCQASQSGLANLVSSSRGVTI